MDPIKGFPIVLLCDGMGEGRHAYFLLTGPLKAGPACKATKGSDSREDR